MGKHFSIVLVWILVIGVIFGLRTAGRLRADPTDDFSFTWAYVPGPEAFRLMPESRVTEILQDRLDLFPRSEAPRLARFLLDLCKQYRFDPAFVLSMIQVESGFHIKAVSSQGAVGLMQVMPATAVVTTRGMGIDLESVRFGQGRRSASEVAARLLTDPFTNLYIGLAYLSRLRDHYGERSTYFLVAAYNVGPARMDELLSRKDFKPVSTKRYFDAIRRGVPGLRYYRREV